MSIEVQVFTIEREPWSEVATGFGRAGDADVVFRLTITDARNLIPLLASGPTKFTVGVDEFISVKRRPGAS